MTLLINIMIVINEFYNIYKLNNLFLFNNYSFLIILMTFKIKSHEFIVISYSCLIIY